MPSDKNQCTWLAIVALGLLFTIVSIGYVWNRSVEAADHQDETPSVPSVRAQDRTVAQTPAPQPSASVPESSTEPTPPPNEPLGLPDLLDKQVSEISSILGEQSAGHSNEGDDISVRYLYGEGCQVFAKMSPKDNRCHCVNFLYDSSRVVTVGDIVRPLVQRGFSIGYYCTEPASLTTAPGYYYALLQQGDCIWQIQADNGNGVQIALKDDIPNNLKASKTVGSISRAQLGHVIQVWYGYAKNTGNHVDDPYDLFMPIRAGQIHLIEQ